MTCQYLKRRVDHGRSQNAWKIKNFQPAIQTRVRPKHESLCACSNTPTLNTPVRCPWTSSISRRKMWTMFPKTRRTYVRLPILQILRINFAENFQLFLILPYLWPQVISTTNKKQFRCCQYHRNNFHFVFQFFNLFQWKSATS